jgi:hypothetical protein
MSHGGGLGGLEAGFLSAIDAAVRGDRRGQAGAPDPAKAELLLKGSVAPEAAPAIDVEEFRRRRRERELAARLQELDRRNAEAWRDQSEFLRGGGRVKGVDWRGV